MGKNMRGKPLNTPLPSPEEEKEQDELLLEVYYQQQQTDALRRRRAEPMASYLLREILLDQIRPPGLQS
jgi:hypothetical protein